MHLNLIQVAESLGVEESVVMAWIRHEGLPCVKDSGRLLFDRAQVAGWATERGMAARAGFLRVSPGPASAENCNALVAMLRCGGIWRNVPSSVVPATLAKIIDRLTGLSPEIRRMLAQRVQTPGALTWAPVGHSLALPHLRSRVALGRDSGLIALLLLSGNLDIQEESPDGSPVNRLLFFMAPTPRAHLELLASLSTALSRGPFGQRVRDAAPDDDIFSALAQSCPAAPKSGPTP